LEKIRLILLYVLLKLQNFAKTEPTYMHTNYKFVNCIEIPFTLQNYLLHLQLRFT